ncbi:MAG: hypothetical protein U9Q74_14975, partial [Gemmatimonadota bacterium]|nr:hypothetical protein [Gemmatimonadota bacterium]
MQMMDTSGLAALCCSVILLTQAGTFARAAERSLVVEGEATAAIVVDTPDAEGAHRAADELIYHVRRASRVELATIERDDIDALPEDHTVVVIGGGELAESLGVPVSDLREEEFIVRTVGRHVVFAGSDTAGNAGDDVSPATLWAVGYFLDRHMGVRWLWPGDLGTFVPEAETITVPDLQVR